MKEEVRLIIAFALAILIIVIFSRMQPRMQPREQNDIQREESRQVPAAASSTETPATPSGEKVLVSPISAVPVEPEGKSEEKSYDDGRYVLTLDTLKGSVKNLGIKKYSRKDEPFFAILENSELLFDYTGEGIKPVYSLSSLDEQNGRVEFTGRLQKMKIWKRMDIPSEGNTFSAAVQMKNEGRESLNIGTYVVRAGKIAAAPNRSRKERDFNPPEILISTGGEIVKTGVARIKSDAYYEETDWIALKERYSLLLIRTGSRARSFVKKEEGFINIGFIYDQVNIPPGESREIEFSFYAAPRTILWQKRK